MNETDHLPPEEPIFTFTPIQAGKADADLIPLTGESQSLTPSPTMRVTAIWMTAVKSLRSVAANNLDYIRITTSTEDRLSNRFYHCFNHLLEDVEVMQPIIEKLNENAYKFDFERVPANGFRSLLSVTDTCMCRLVQTSRVIESRRDALFARRNMLLRDLEEYTKVLGELERLPERIEYRDVGRPRCPETVKIPRWRLCFVVHVVVPSTCQFRVPTFVLAHVIPCLIPFYLQVLCGSCWSTLTT